MSFEIVVYRGRTCDFSLTISDVDGNAITIAAGDVIRMKIGSGVETVPLLDLDSAAPSAAGSSITASNPATVRLAQDDTLELVPGTFDAEVGVVDDSETSPPDAFKHASSGVVHVVGTLGGEVGTT